MTNEELLNQLIELHKVHNELLAQNNVNQLFMIGTLSAIFVCFLLYKAIKKFI